MKKETLTKKINTIKKQLNTTANTIFMLEKSITDDDCIEIMKEIDKAIKHLNNTIKILGDEE